MSCGGCSGNHEHKFDGDIEKQLAKDAIERNKMKRLCIICATICVVCTLAFGAIIATLAAGVQIERTTETTTTQTVEGDAATINNVDGEQYNDNAVNGGAN